MPKFDRISPMAGAKRLFGKEAWVNFAKGLAKKPADRWQTIEEMADAIRALHGEPLEGERAKADRTSE